MSVLVVALLNAAALDPCPSLPERLSELREAAISGAAIEDRQLRLESNLRRPLLHHTERSLPIEERAELIGQRARSACELQARLSSFSGRGADRARLKQILDRAEFARARTRIPDPVARWLRRLVGWLESFFDGKGAESFAAITRALVLGAAAAAAAVGLIRVALGRRAANAPKPAGLLAAPESLEDPAAHLALARAAVNTDPREAIRQGLLALLSWLEARRLARRGRAKTNRELARELPERGASAELCEAVASLIGWYDRAFYSLSGVAPEEARRFVDRVAALQSRSEGAPS